MYGKGLSDGRCRSSHHVLWAPAETLKKNGLSCFVIGISSKVGTRLVYEISGRAKNSLRRNKK
jgi:hypothetical protein